MRMRVVFLGTGGGRFNLIEQTRWTGGFLIIGQGRVHVDPGPGALVRMRMLGLDPKKTDGVIVTHAHVDHYNDLQVITEGISHYTLKRRGFALVTNQIIDMNILDHYHSTLLNHVLTFPYSDSLPRPCDSWMLHSVKVDHGKPECYGFVLEEKGKRLGYTSDTRYFPGLGKYFFGCDLLIVNLTAMKKREGLYHLTMEDIERFLNEAKPKKAVFTHLGIEVQQFGIKKAEEMINQLYSKGEVEMARDGGVIEI